MVEPNGARQRCSAITGRWELWPAVFGIGLGFLLAGFAMSNVLSALKPYPVPDPGANPFSSPPGAGGLTVILQMVAGLGTVVLNLPALAFGIGALMGHSWMAWGALALAVVLGPATLVLGTRWGNMVYERRAPELLAELSRLR